MFRIIAAAVLLSGCQTIPLGESNTQIGFSRDRMLHVVALPFNRRLILIRDTGLFWCYGEPHGTHCKPNYTGNAIRTRTTGLEP